MTPYNITVDNTGQRSIRPYHYKLGTTQCHISGSKTILEMVVAEMKLHHINVSSMVVERCRRVLPDSKCSNEQLTIIRQLFTQPMLVSNSDLQKIINLELSGKKRRRSGGDIISGRRHEFYIRSWTFAPIQLCYLVKYMKQEGCRFPELDEWMYISFTARSRTLTVRYIGTISGCRTAFRRFRDDLAYKAKSTLLGAFQDALERYFPQIFHAAELHTVSDASLDVFGNESQIGSQFNADDTERFLIAMLGHYSLLNQQLGGHYNSYLPNTSDDDLLRKLNAIYFTKFETNCKQFPEHKWLNLSDEFAMVRHKAYEMGHLLADIHETQAKPFQCFNETVLIFLGEELSSGHLASNCSFLCGHGKSSSLVRSFCYRIRNIEYNNYYGDIRSSYHQMPKAFTFINILPLPNYSDYLGALVSLQKYLQCVRPVILASFGQKAAETVISHFKTIPTRSREANISAVLGERALSVYSYGKHDENVFIHIPLSHPGRYQRGQRRPEGLRFFYISMQFTFLIASCAIRVLEKNATHSTNLCRRDLCINILNDVRCQLQSEHGQPFTSNMNSARDAALYRPSSFRGDSSNQRKSSKDSDERASRNQERDASNDSEVTSYNQHPSPSHRDPSVDYAFDSFDREIENWCTNQSSPEVSNCINYIGANAEKPAKAIDIASGNFIKVPAIFGQENALPIFEDVNLCWLYSLGRAVGRPHSKERLNDLENIWRLNVPELHLIVRHDEEMRGSWIESLAGLQQGQSLFLGVVSQLPDALYLQALLGHNQPRWLVDKRRAQELKQVLHEGVIRCGLWVQREALTSSVAFYPTPFITAEEMQGYPIGVKDDGEFRIRWKDPDGSNRSLLLNAQFAISKTSRDLRALCFTEHGLDIVDAAGNPLRPRKTWSGVVPLASIPRSRFAATQPGQALEDLWLAVLKHDKHTIIKTDSENEKSSHHWGPAGVKMIPTLARKEIPPQNRPPKQNDANFLLVKFINKRFPDGGIFRTAPRAKVPDSTEDLQAFVEFCRTPEYRHHPYSAKWCAILDGDRAV